MWPCSTSRRCVTIYFLFHFILFIVFWSCVKNTVVQLIVCDNMCQTASVNAFNCWPKPCKWPPSVRVSEDCCLWLRAQIVTEGLLMKLWFSDVLMKVLNLQWLLGPASLLLTLTLDVPELEVPCLTTKILIIWTGNSEHHPGLQSHQNPSCPRLRSGSCSETFKNTTKHWPEEDGDRGTDFRGGENPGV